MISLEASEITLQRSRHYDSPIWYVRCDENIEKRLESFKHFIK